MSISTHFNPLTLGAITSAIRLAVWLYNAASLNFPPEWNTTQVGSRARLILVAVRDSSFDPMSQRRMQIFAKIRLGDVLFFPRPELLDDITFIMPVLSAYAATRWPRTP
jgi:hypothetical protein